MAEIEEEDLVWGGIYELYGETRLLVGAFDAPSRRFFGVDMFTHNIGVCPHANTGPGARACRWLGNVDRELLVLPVGITLGLDLLDAFAKVVEEHSSSHKTNDYF